MSYLGRTLTTLQEGLKAHEGGQQHPGNPFDMFSNFFGGGRMQRHFCVGRAWD